MIIRSFFLFLFSLLIQYSFAVPKLEFPVDVAGDLNEHIEIDGKKYSRFVIGRGRGESVHVILFPENAEQLSTKDVVRFACAKVEDDAITDWYMKMFGVKKEGANYLQIGLDKDNNPKRIIDIEALIDNDASNELPKKYDNQKDAFIKNFKKIASTAVGRVLLYRLLIEIRRHDGTVNKVGCVDSGIAIPIAIANRNDCRHLTINWKSDGNSFSYPRQTINFGVQFPTRKPTTVGQNTDPGYHEIILYSRPDDVGLLHEMIHWYHFLRHTERYTVERNADNGSIKIDGKKEGDHTIYVHIGNYYWPTAIVDKWKLSAMPWFVINGEELAIGFEEIRTILGSRSDITGYIRGDDISENLYRSCDNQPLRFGHSGTAFYEDKLVIDKIKSACDNERHIYSTNLYNSYMAISVDPRDKPRFKYPSTVLKNGIGHLKIPQISVELMKP